jgi:hypothetical protein
MRTQRCPDGAPRLQWGWGYSVCAEEAATGFSVFPCPGCVYRSGEVGACYDKNGSQLPRRYTPRRYHRLTLSKYLAGFSGVAGRHLLAKIIIPKTYGARQITSLSLSNSMTEAADVLADGVTALYVRPSAPEARQA